MEFAGVFESGEVSETIPLSPSAASHALSKGAKAGIVLGSAAGLLFFLWLFVCLMVRKDKNRQKSAESALPEVDMKVALLQAAI